MARGDNYIDGAAFGEAPMGPQPQGQPAGEMWPGNPRMQIRAGGPGPDDRSLRVDALYRTIESRDHLKARAGERMADRLNKGFRSAMPPMQPFMSPGDLER